MGARRRPIAFPNLVCPVLGWCVAVKERGPAYKITGDAIIGTYLGGAWHQVNLPLKGLDPLAAKSPSVQITGLSCPVLGWCAMVGTYNYGYSKPEGLDRHAVGRQVDHTNGAIERPE